jgi:zinc transport system permease protein
MMLEILSYGFMQRAIIAGMFIAIACAFLGVFLILRRDAMIGHGLAHVTFAGVAIGLFLNIMPLAAALILAVLTALIILKLKEKAGIYGDTAIAIFSSTGFALGILLVSLSQDFTVDLFGYLFGDILAITSYEVVLSIALAILVVLIFTLNYRPFMYATFDRESAKVAGIKVNRLDILLTILTAVTVVLGMKVVGILLVSALVVIPAAAGLQLASNFKQSMVISALVASISVVAGVFLSFYLDFPASGTIVILSFVIFIFFFAIKRGKTT